MPIKPENKKLYPKNWRTEIRPAILLRAGDKCEWCSAKNGKPHPITGSKVVLTIMHLDHNPRNSDHSNLMAACQRCHLRYDAKHHAENAKKTLNAKGDK
jgi:5-methylcytosine-specific restriction endonuclease McrA